MIPSETATHPKIIEDARSSPADHVNPSTILSVDTNDHESFPLLMHASAPSPPLARMEEEDFNIHHNSHPELDDMNHTGVSTPETDLIGGNDDDEFTLEGRAMTDEPDAAFPVNALIPYGPGSGIFITDNNNQQVFIPDVVNTYQQKKNLAQGMMDLALLSANANQLRYVLETFDRHPYNYVSLVLISISLIIQVAVGIGLILNSQYNVTKEGHIEKADRINNYTVIGIFLTTVVNVFITSFGVADTNSRA